MRRARREVGRLGLLLVVVLFALPVTGRSALAREPGTFERHTFTNSAGSRDYMLYVPPNPRPNRPLVVFIPGATATAEQAATDTRWNELAAREGFFVLYPEAALEEGGYFHYMDDGDQHRGAGAPSIIAGTTDLVVSQWRLDPSRIFIGGMSNGAAMANVMVTTYPDRYAAVFAHSGCAYRGDCGAVVGSSVTAEKSASAIVTEMGSRARVVPFIAFQGTADPTVPPELSARVVESWLRADDAVDDGAGNGSIPLTPTSIARGAVPNGRAFEVNRYRDSRGCLLGEYWIVQDMRHAYSGGRPTAVPGLAVDPASERKVSAAGTDPAGPDATGAAYAFFLDHPRTEGGFAGCRQVS